MLVSIKNRITVLLGFGLACALILVVLPDRPAAAFVSIGGCVLGVVGGAIGLWSTNSKKGRERLAWLVMSIGSFGWAVANGATAWDDYVSHQVVLAPSPFDVCYLLFPLGLLIGVSLLQTRVTTAWTIASILDGLIATVSLLIVFWVSMIGPAWNSSGAAFDAAAQAGSLPEPALSLLAVSYPAFNLLLVVAVCLLGIRSRVQSDGSLGFLALTILGIAFTNAMFMVHTANDNYVAGQLWDLGSLVAFPAFALAALGARSPRPTREMSIDLPVWQIAVPYIPLLAGVLVTGFYWVTGRDLDTVHLVAQVTVFGLVLARQLIIVTHNSSLTRQLRHQAFHDVLTGLPNRGLFADRLDHAVALHQRDSSEVAVVLIDLDDFKVVNDTLGHDAGDAFLLEVAARLSTCVRVGDTVARLGGDEFAIVLENSSSLQPFIDRIASHLQRPMPFGDRDLTVSASIGAVSRVVHDSGIEPHLVASELMKDADLALYAAKAKGKGTHEIFQQPMRQAFDESVTMRHALANAISSGSLRVAYQPIVELATGEIIALEALARWNDPVHGEVPPMKFIAVAEEAGLIPELGELVLEQACQQFMSWNLPEHVYLSVNVSPLQFEDPLLPDRVIAILGRYNLTPQRLVLEVTESVLIESQEIAKSLQILRGLGVRIAVDDFGTGYSSLRYLHTLPIDILKVDRSYVSGVAEDDESSRLVMAILGIATALGLNAVAEGIEEESELQCLESLGCTVGQGYLFSKPLEAASVRRFLTGASSTGPTLAAAETASGDAVI